MPAHVRRWAGRYEEHGIEVMRMVDRCRARPGGWNVRHFYSWYRRDGGERSYGWVKDHLQRAEWDYLKPVGIDISMAHLDAHELASGWPRGQPTRSSRPWMRRSTS